MTAGRRRSEEIDALLYELDELRGYRTNPQDGEGVLRGAVVQASSLWSGALRSGTLRLGPDWVRRSAMWLLKAASVLERGRGSSPEQATLGRFMANLLMGRLAQAFQQAEALLDRGPSAQAVHQWCNVLVADARLGDLIESLEEGLRRYRAQHQESPWPSFLLSRLLFNKNPQEALALTDGFPALPRRHLWMRYWRGRLLLYSGRYGLAEEEFRATDAAMPGLGDRVWAFVGEARLCRGDFRGCLEAFDRALSRAGQDRFAQANVLAWRGGALVWAGQWKRALRDLSRSMKHGPSFARGWLGASLFMLGRTREALAELDETLRFGPADCESRLWRAQVLRASGKMDSAEIDVEWVLTEHPYNDFALINRALLRLAQGRPREAFYDAETLPPEVRDWVARTSGREWPGHDDSGGLGRALEKGLEAARGVRRSDWYLRPLWINGPAADLGAASSLEPSSKSS